MKKLTNDFEFFASHFLLKNRQIVDYHQLVVACEIDLQKERLNHADISKWIRKKIKSGAIQLLDDDSYRKVFDENLKNVMEFAKRFEERRAARASRFNNPDEHLT